MRYYILFLFIFISFYSKSQENIYVSPVKIPIFLSGSFGELRSNHFHSGIDIKTQQRIGLPVYSVADGYIDRIVVSPTGFGKALYINHPNGTTSVYAHLENFRNDITTYVRNIQYEEESFQIDVKVPENKIMVKQDEMIARSGNTGSSGGPHLHFEIRDTESEEPINPLSFNMPVPDNTPPRLFAVMIVPLNKFSHVDYHRDKKIFPVTSSDGKYHLKEKQVVPVYGNIGIAVHANDYFDGSLNPCGLYSLKVWFDGELYYSYEMNRFSFNETRYINSFIDYGEYMTNRRRFQKTWIEPGNKLSIYSNTQRGGNLKLTDGNYHPVKIELSDIAGNTSSIEFTLSSQYKSLPEEKRTHLKLMRFDQPNEYSNQELKIELPEEALYNDLQFEYKMMPGIYAPIHVIQNNKVPLHNSMLVSLKAGTLDEKHYSKAFLAGVDTISGKVTYAGGAYEDGWITGHIRSFGNYTLAIDTIPPVITALSFGQNGELSESSRIRFRVTDNLSGIGEIKGMLDNKWALFEYDAKTSTIQHTFDAERFELGKRHTLILFVTDNKDNISVYEASFWK